MGWVLLPGCPGPWEMRQRLPVEEKLMGAEAVKKWLPRAVIGGKSSVHLPLCLLQIKVLSRPCLDLQGTF